MTKAILKYLPVFHDELKEAFIYIRDVLKNEKAAHDLVQAIKNAILQRSECPDSFERYKSLKEREYPYYRIYVKNYQVYYVVIPGDPPIMEVRRLVYNKRDLII